MEEVKNNTKTTGKKNVNAGGTKEVNMNANEVAKEKRFSKKDALWIGAGVLAGAGIGAGVTYAFTKRSKKEQTVSRETTMNEQSPIEEPV